jgi:hypothetical protein
MSTLATLNGVDISRIAALSNKIQEVYLKADAPQEILEDLHQQVLKTSPVGQTFEKAIPLHATLVHA